MCAASSPNGSATKNGREQGGNTPVNVVPPSYATKLRPSSSTMANLWKLEANVPNDADYDVWLPFRSMSDNLVMVVPNFEGNGYTKETIRVEYEWKPPHCCTCLIFSHSLNNCPKAPKQVVNKMDKCKSGSFGADSEASKSSGVGYGTKSLLEQWRETYVNDDYDPYDDDMYEGQNIPDNIQSICDNLDIKVRGRMKK
ncbi:hypothetical protein Tco_0435039 [Tanacetum coccineum]